MSARFAAALKNFQVLPGAGGCCVTDAQAHMIKFGANWLFH
jgi:hypothetical protein